MLPLYSSFCMTNSQASTQRHTLIVTYIHIEHICLSLNLIVPVDGHREDMLRSEFDSSFGESTNPVAYPEERAQWSTLHTVLVVIIAVYSFV